jgi:alpha-beta hydrolase superfamily lysophospholipase
VNRFRLLALSALMAALTCAGLARSPVGAQTLPRHGVLGVVLADRDHRIAVTAVLPASAAARAGLQPGDALVTIDGAAVADVKAFLSSMKGPAGRIVSLGVERGGVRSTFTATLQPAPRERDPHAAQGKHPAVLVIGGIGCYSIDTASAEDPYLNLAHDLSRKGIVVMRLEKSGLGDSQGPPCDGVDFNTEAASYDAALETLAGNPLVDPGKIYLFGHSIGSVIAPRMALRHRVAGVIVAEGVGRDWYEYELINERGQLALAGMKADEVDASMLVTERCKYEILIAREPAVQILRDQPDCAGDIAYPVTAAYLQQVAALNVAEPWTKISAPVLFIYGTADFVTTEADHRLLYAIVDRLHTGNATLRIIEGMDHYLTPAASQQVSFDRAFGRAPRGPYDGRFSETIIAWLCARERCS